MGEWCFKPERVGRMTALDVRSKLVCPECGSSKLYKDGLHHTNEGQVQRYLCRVCGYRFSQSSVKVNVMGKVGETFDSGNNNHKVGVASGDGSYEKVYDCLPFSFSEDVGSHDISIVEKGLNNLPFYNRNTQVCANKGAKNLNTTTETKTVAGTENQNTKGKIIEFIWKRAPNMEIIVLF